MRDKLIHEYFGVDLVLVWDVVEQELPGLRSRWRSYVSAFVDDGRSVDRPPCEPRPLALDPTKEES